MFFRSTNNNIIFKKKLEIWSELNSQDKLLFHGQLLAVINLDLWKFLLAKTAFAAGHLVQYN